MKNTILRITAIAFVAMVTFASCNTPAQKVQNAKDKVENAEDDLDKANREYLTEVENFRRDVSAQIVTNDQLIAELKAKASRENRVLKANYQVEIVSLEKKNNDMKMKLDNYKEDGKKNWATFRDEVNREMNEIGRAVKDFFTDNKK